MCRPGPFVLLQISVTVVTLLTVAFWLLACATGRAARAVDLARAVGRVGRACPLLAIMTFACVALAGAARADPTVLGIPLEFRVARKE